MGQAGCGRRVPDADHEGHDMKAGRGAQGQGFPSIIWYLGPMVGAGRGCAQGAGRTGHPHCGRGSRVLLGGWGAQRHQRGEQVLHPWGRGGSVCS